jgi:bla regulator protein BlaR1
MTPLHILSSPVEISLASHLLQSTLFTGAAGLLTLVLKKNHARARYWLWLAASVKFLVPFSLLVNIGSRLGWSNAHPVIRRMTVIVEEIRLPGNPLVFNPGGPAAFQPAHTIVPSLLLTLWACGLVAVLFFWWRRWRRVTAVVRAAVPLTEGREFEALRRVVTSLEHGAWHRSPTCVFAGLGRRRARRRCAAQTQVGRPVPQVLSSGATLEPGIFGIFRPVLLLPAGIAERLDDAQLDAIIAHELCHARRRDNLMAAVHMVIEAVFWFHPLVWWLGARLVDERERACDEEVLHLCGQPEAYAEGILKVCRFYLESPIVCVAGITGSNLKRRIERIMTQQTGHGLSLGRKLLLGAAALTTLAAPVTIGLLNAPPGRAQTPAGAPSAFEVASIKPNKSGARGGQFSTEPGGIVATNMPLRTFIKAAYGVQDYQLSGGPGWIDSERYDVAAKSEGAVLDDKLLLMLRALLEERFKLTLHREKKELPGYALVIGKSGLKIRQAEHAGENWMRFGRGSLTARAVSMARLADSLAGRLGRPVVDDTGIKGLFDIKLEWTPDQSEPRGPKERGAASRGRQCRPNDLHGPAGTARSQTGTAQESG